MNPIRHPALQSRSLVIRLSSLGDLILATRFLQTLPEAQKVDWLVSQEFAPLLEGHPQIEKVWSFNRNASLGEWLRFSAELAKQNYGELFDLHGSLRSRILRWLFRVRSKNTVQFSIPKRRWRLTGFFVFKKLWPKEWRPVPWAVRYESILNGGRTRAPKAWLEHLASSNRKGSPRIGLMPSSAWPGKNWNLGLMLPIFGKLLTENPDLTLEVLGTSRDEASRDLFRRLEHRHGERVVSQVGKLNLKELAQKLSEFQLVISVDTGIAHLAEAVGTPVIVTFGPTHPEQGFGPSLKESAAIQTRLWCSPCSKDGSACFRIKSRYLCQKRLSETEIVLQVRRLMSMRSDHT